MNRLVVMALAAVAYVLLGAWGVINLADGDWFIGGVMLACAVVGLPSLLARARKERRDGHDTVR